MAKASYAENIPINTVCVYMYVTAEAPSITSGPYRELSLAVGQSTTLQCHADGAPAPAVAWYHGLLLPNSTDRLVGSGYKLRLKVILSRISFLVLYIFKEVYRIKFERVNRKGLWV